MDILWLVCATPPSAFSTACIVAPPPLQIVWSLWGSCENGVASQVLDLKKKKVNSCDFLFKKKEEKIDKDFCQNRSNMSLNLLKL